MARCQTFVINLSKCVETISIKKVDCRLSRTSALIGLSESLWNECIIIVVIIKREEQYTYNIWPLYH